MIKQTGKATYRDGKLYFDATGWAMVQKAAKRQKTTPKKVVIEAIKRCYAQH